MNEPESQTRLSPLLIHLFKGVLYRDQYIELWQNLLDLQAQVRDYVQVLGLELMLDEAEGFAFLLQQMQEDEEQPLPRLITRRQLSYPLSLLCILLRKRLVEQDAGGGESRTILSKQQMVEMMRVFLPDKGNETKQVDQIGRHINKLVEYGFLRKLQGSGDQFEVRRIIKALVNADWLGEIESKLQSYQDYVAEQE